MPEADDAERIENLPPSQLLKKLAQRYTKKPPTPDPFGRSPATPKQIKEALEKFWGLLK